MLDGATQIANRDAFIYQEMMAHVPLFDHGNAREVLIVGGGDCAIAKEVLKHKTVRASRRSRSIPRWSNSPEDIFRNSPNRCSPTAFRKRDR